MTPSASSGPRAHGTAATPDGALPDGAAMPGGAAVPDAVAMPGGAAAPGRATMPGGAAAPGKAAMPGGAAPGKAAMPGGAAVPGGRVVPGGGRVVPGGVRSPVASGLRRRVAVAWEELAPGRVLPAGVRAELGLGLEGGERLLAADMGPDGEWALVATDRALYLRPSDRGAGSPACGHAGGWARLGWELIAQVGWDEVAGQLIVLGAAGPAAAEPGDQSGAARANEAGAASGDEPGAVSGDELGAAAPRVVGPLRVVVPLRRRGGVPELALERITHTRLGRWELLAAGGRRAVIEARRRPVTGELVWSVTCDGCGLGDQDLRAGAERAIARLSTEFGALAEQGTGLALPRPRPRG